MKITVLRLGHRISRDKRVTTHCALVSRAFGAEKIILSGEEDEKLLETIEKVVENWGGKFKAKFEKNWRRAIKNFKGIKVHLTFYGMPLQEKAGEIIELGKKTPIMIIIGAEKVPREVYYNSDYNLSITSQPHSEVAALAITLHELMQGKELEKEFQDKAFGKAKRKIVPSEKGKKFA